MTKIIWIIVGIIILTTVVFGFVYYTNISTINYKNREYKVSTEASLSYENVNAKYGEIIDSGDSYKGRRIYIGKNSLGIANQTSTVIFLKDSDFYRAYGLVGGP